MAELGIFEVESTETEELGMKENYTVVCIVENRTREVCIALMNTAKTYELHLYLLQDSFTYSDTIDQISAMEPDEILLHDGSKNRPLTKKIVRTIDESTSKEEKARILMMSRNLFDQDKGAELLKEVLLKVDNDLMERYTVLSSSFCLLHYLQNCTGSKFGRHCISVSFHYDTRGRLCIDRQTVKHLELISNARTGSQKASLFGVINRTQTEVGAQALKRNLLGPPTSINVIEGRYELVGFFLSHEAIFADLDSHLKKLKDLDRMLSGIVMVPQKLDLPVARRGIDTLIILKHTLTVIQILTETLHGAMKVAIDEQDQQENSAVLLKIAIDSLSHSAFPEISAKISELLTDSTMYTKVIKNKQHEEIFCVRAGINGLLDVARKTYLQSVEDIFKLVETYRESYNIDVKPLYTQTRGYHLVMPADVPSLPDVFIQAVKNRKTINCTTAEIVYLSDRAREATEQAFLLTNECLQNLMLEIRSHLDALSKMVDSVAQLDMIFSFSKFMASSHLPFVRPKLKEGRGALAIKQGRNILMCSMSDQDFVPNDVFATSLSSFQIITGPNASGKTTFLKQIALSVILAQIGCYVPAQEAFIPVRDRLMTRIGTCDDMENNISTFQMEMKDMGYILQHVTERSLVIIDELGRGTSTSDGMAIAWAVSEALIQSGSYCFFATHFMELTDLPTHYRQAANIHLTAEEEGETGKERLRFLHQISEGPSQLKSDYGIIIAEMCGFTEAVIEDAKATKTKMLEKRSQDALRTKGTAEQAHDMSALMRRLLLLQDSSMHAVALRAYLQNLRDACTTKMDGGDGNNV